LKEWLPLEEVLSFDHYKDDYSIEDVDMIVDQVLKVAKDVLAPTADEGETIGARWENGKTYIPPSFGKAIRFLHDQGWGASNMNFQESGIVPNTIYGFLYEMLSAANPALMPYVGAGGIVAHVINLYGDEVVKKRYTEKLFSGVWGGTMCLTEPASGSDVGDMLAKAYPTDDPKIFKIKGQKIFITVGDRDDVENVVHLYLARVDGAAKGTKGLSLFVSPKFWVNDDGTLSDNDVQCIGIEHKMGLKGQVTAQMVHGENGKCLGYLLGNPPDADGKGDGMMQMFNMMNEARLDTGRLATCVAANAYWNAKNYGKERIQGRLLTNPKSDRVTINKHEDVKRMYLLNKATLEGCRALLGKCYYYEDLVRFSPDPERRKWAHGKLEMLTPLCKAYPSDEAWGLIAESIQSYGGYGYCEEYPAANSARDVKIWSLWEGTNYIQSMDLIGRKWTQGKGAIFADLLKEVDDFIAEHKGKLDGLETELAHLEKALAAYRGIQGMIFQYATTGKLGLMAVYARRILTATSQLYCGYLLMDQAVIAKRRMAELGEGHFEYNFYLGKVLSARYFLNNAVPNVWHVAELVKIGDTSVIEAPDEIFEY
jgi:alkylation response protein AidB-like acyl-CoA dehydrogenase